MRKTLIVEDDALLNKTLAYKLISEGYEVKSAFTCAAVSFLQKSEFDLALLDINLPDGNGLDFCEEIRKRDQNSYIIFLTANDKGSDMLERYEASGADYITRPFSIAVLCRKIMAVFANMELRHLQHDLYEDDVLKIDFSEYLVSFAGEPLDLTQKEYRTLLLFVKYSSPEKSSCRSFTSNIEYQRQFAKHQNLH